MSVAACVPDVKWGKNEGKTYFIVTRQNITPIPSKIKRINP